MIRESVIKLLCGKFTFELTQGQIRAIEVLGDYMLDKNPESALIMKGYAGTGKTTLVSGLISALEALNYKSILMAPTGRAAKVLSNYTGRMAYTIHKKIYRQKSSKDGFGEFVIDRNLHKNTFFIVDESSMITNQVVDSSIFGSGNVLDDLFTYILNGINCKLIFIGDTAQLPPVGFKESPALQKNDLLVYIKKVFETELTEVVRQEEESGILENATRIRLNISCKKIKLPVMKLSNYPDIERITGMELADKISESYDRNGIHQTVVITRSNKRANQYNEGIRKAVLWREEELSKDDFLMVVKNNYYWLDENDENMGFIANGDIARIVRIHKYENIYDFRFADVTLEFIDYNNFELRTKILLNAITVDAPSLSAEDNKKLFYNILEDYTEIKGKKNQYNKVRENEYFNALQVKFAYAVTCHKAQGGQWNTVFIDQGYLKEEMITMDYLRWLYTSFTRATEKLYLVNFSDQFFRFD